MAASSKEPWEKPNPKAAQGKSRKLTGSQKTAAKRAAKKGGRSKPSLVDNMNAAKKSSGKKAATKKAATKKSAAKRSTAKKSAASK